MKRKKVITVLAMAITCATMASCGKTTETVNAEPVIQATEQIVLETEESTQVSADQGEGDSITLEPTTDENSDKANQDKGDTSNGDYEIDEELMDYVNENGYEMPSNWVPPEDIPTYTEPAGTLEELPPEYLESLPSLQ